ncbi:ANTAR domain-containing protein [Streptomyces sp. MZ04]|uniref:ANTAR domain-containing protein n=1 Tax=Streptomyces sp. MZ04 TaxID=2559236 RepID=UPI00107E6F8F|nr:ANTAR domain-containing protein [Streptomyces sp. MZ04]TGB08460.1 ANTAR domain-containing protein [Streptomyces sp. MZ04]
MPDRTSELRLAEVLVEASDTLADDFDPEHYLSRVAGHCVELLDAAAAGVLVEGECLPSLVAIGHPRPLALDLLKTQQGGGPCVESFGTGRAVPPVRLTTAESARRWPEFTARAREFGIEATYAVPLRQRDMTLGALNVFVADAPHDGSSDGELRLAQAIADAAAVGLHNRRTHTEYRRLVGQLQSALTSRIRIEQAKGILAERWHVDVDEAFAALRRYARRERLVMAVAATSVIGGSIDDAALRDGWSEPSGEGP